MPVVTTGYFRKHEHANLVVVLDVAVVDVSYFLNRVLLVFYLLREMQMYLDSPLLHEMQMYLDSPSLREMLMCLQELPVSYSSNRFLLVLVFSLRMYVWFSDTS